MSGELRFFEVFFAYEKGVTDSHGGPHCEQGNARGVVADEGPTGWGGNSRVVDGYRIPTETIIWPEIFEPGGLDGSRRSWLIPSDVAGGRMPTAPWRASRQNLIAVTGDQGSTALIAPTVSSGSHRWAGGSNSPHRPSPLPPLDSVAGGSFVLQPGGFYPNAFVCHTVFDSVNAVMCSMLRASHWCKGVTTRLSVSAAAASHSGQS